MIFLWVGLAFLLMKYFEIGPVATWSWWWVLAPLACAILWFEGLERLFGFDRRKLEHAEHEKRRKERLEQTFATAGGKKRK